MSPSSDAANSDSSLCNHNTWCQEDSEQEMQCDAAPAATQSRTSSPESTAESSSSSTSCDESVQTTPTLAEFFLKSQGAHAISDFSDLFGHRIVVTHRLNKFETERSGLSYIHKYLRTNGHATMTTSLAQDIQSDMDTYARDRSTIMEDKLPLNDHTGQYFYKPARKPNDAANIGKIKYSDENCIEMFTREKLECINNSSEIPFAAKSMHYDVVASYHYLHSKGRNAKEIYNEYHFDDLLMCLLEGTATQYLTKFEI